MESNSYESSRADAVDALNTLTADRERLVQSIHVPRALLAAYGALGAWWVAAAATASPGTNFEPPSSGWLGLLGVLVVSHLIRRETGIRFRAMGTRAAWAVIGILASCSTLFSVALGLVSLGARWAVAPISVAAFAVTTWLAGVAYQSAAEKLRRE
ncbi:hypothetical protein C1I97_09155 [Streptomyces sp. NTH33]|uniref:hypothetical protein n=1 Tax=Streptomyces sp. NTH33 TaxID=1735453 RepID=UPI000DA94A04|nr:hypothetical protein [Streptomyces sp. NTH33]PZH15023.1 hypothetical protein C1I97_09155 [Streptomyces sp. NTH33]